MGMKNFLIFDLGASRGRAVVARFDGKRFELDEVHRFENGPVYATGTWFWDILRLFSEVKTGIVKAAGKYDDITSIGIDTWGVDFGLIDKNGMLLSNPVCYRNERGNSLMPEVLKIISKYELFAQTGIFIISISSLFHLYAMKKDRFTPLEQAAGFLMIPDLLAYLLTGNPVNEYTTATTTVIFNQVEKRWAHEVLDTLDLPTNIFTDPIFPGTGIGAIKEDIRGELGVPPIHVVAPASHDTASVEAGVPAISSGESWAFLSVGTWAVAGMETVTPVISREVFATGFGNEGSATGGSFLACNINGLFIIQQCRARWAADQKRAIPWNEIAMDSLAAPALQYFIDVDDPAFSQPFVDMPEKITEYLGKSGQIPANEMSGLARCIYESLVMKFRYRLEQLTALTGKSITVIHMVGGGSQHKGLCQWTADATGISVLAGPVEATVAGNLIVQLMSCGEIDSINDGRRIVGDSSLAREYPPASRQPWDDAYARYRRLLPESAS